ncbi:putative secreted protein (Por secretion system target) [Breznakibacter xylanolyticus]|uniref:Putative secreted protein (Por secretion system target) n=1 Tax=Breznakibacter xylanolyticus TaxID=990 RepID=A0A2W7NGL7_9BACT|nr:T9SS type A sorting domain-containing protein [Breznakibacter xylanolyticus]PZX18623.1 putative secreted protein (Por secretion system target) [Breznakibacter xylanolyticus]
MRKFYDDLNVHRPATRNWVRKTMGTLGVAALLALPAQVVAQGTAMSWTGASNTNFTYDANWNPAGTPGGNSLTVPVTTSVTSNNYPVISGSENISVYFLENAYNADPTLITPIVVDLASNDVSLSINRGNTSKIDYGMCGLTINKGTVNFGKDGSWRWDENNSLLTVNGGVVNFNGQVVLWNNKTGAALGSGQITINGGTVKFASTLEPIIRFNETREGGQIIIKGDGKVFYRGNWDCQSKIDNGCINGGSEYSILKTYDAATGYTTLSALPSSTFLIKNADRQLLTAGASGTALEMLKTARVTGAKSLVWKYREEGAVTYTSTGVTEATYTPSFANSGVYYVICEAVDANDVVVQSQEVEINVGSTRISVSPYFNQQYIRVNGVLHPKTASFTETPVSYTWKSFNRDTKEYLEFDGAAGQLTVSPSFTSIGTYDVFVEATFNDGRVERSSVMVYYVEAASTTGKDMIWNGLFSTDGFYSGNYAPVSPTFKNKLTINGSGNVPATFTGSVNDTINALTVAAGASMNLSMNSGVVFNVRGEVYVHGTLNITSGIAHFSSNFTRLHSAGSLLNVSGNAIAIVQYMKMGDSDTPASTNGGQLHVTDNARVYNNMVPDRISTKDPSYSMMYVDDNASIYFPGNSTAVVNTRIADAKIACAKAGYVPAVVYDKSIDSTRIYSRLASGFAIENVTSQIVAQNTETEAAYTLTNLESNDIQAIKWYYGTSLNGPWNELAGSDNQLTYKPAVPVGGTVYVVAIGTTSQGVQVMTNNVVALDVIAVTLSPASQQVLVSGTPVDLTYSINGGLTAQDVAWYEKINGEVDYNAPISTTATFTPSTAALGERIYICLANVEINNVVTTVESSEAVVKVVEVITSVEEKASAQLSVYPNPSKGQFFVDGIEGEYSVEVIDMKGAIVYKNHFTNGGAQEVAIDRKGIFTVKVVSGADVKTTRVVVK